MITIDLRFVAVFVAQNAFEVLVVRRRYVAVGARAPLSFVLAGVDREE
jgi:hypothetical protein